MQQKLRKFSADYYLLIHTHSWRCQWRVMALVSAVPDEGDGLILCEWYLYSYDHTCSCHVTFKGLLWSSLCNLIDMFQLSLSSSFRFFSKIVQTSLIEALGISHHSSNMHCSAWVNWAVSCTGASWNEMNLTLTSFAACMRIYWILSAMSLEC